MYKCINHKYHLKLFSLPTRHISEQRKNDFIKKKDGRPLKTKDDSHILVKRFQNGDTTAFNLLVERWQDKIHRFVYRYLPDIDEANEITQKTFIKAYQRIDTLEEARKFSPWIYKVANNLCLDELKRAGRKRAVPLELNRFEQKSNKTPVTDFENKELADLLNRALMQLPDEQRSVVILKQYEDLTFREIAEILEEPENTIKSRMYYGLKAMRNTLTNWNIETDYLNHE